MAATTSEFRKISRELIIEQFELLKRGNDLAIVAPPRAGKSLVLFEMRRLATCIEGIDRPRVKMIRSSSFQGNNPREFVACLAGILEVPAPASVHPDGDIADDIEPVIRSFCLKDLHPAWLFIQNVTEFAGAYRRALLMAIQVLAADEDVRGRLSVLITGSKEFVSLTYGDNSPFRHAKRYFLTGFDKQLSVCILESRLLKDGVQKGLHWNDLAIAGVIDDSLANLLYEETRGQLYFIDAIAKELRQQIGGVGTTSSTADLMAYLSKAIDGNLMSDQDAQRYLIDVESDERAWDDLIRLTSEDATIKVRSREVPQTLETSGLAVRNDDGDLALSSPLWAKQLRRILKKRRVADVYALQDRWEEAWLRYKRQRAADCYRPMIGPPRIYLNDVIAKWRESLFDLAIRDDCAVVDQFAQGLEHLLGFASGEFRDCRSRPLIRRFGNNIETLPSDRFRDDNESGTDHDNGFRISHDRCRIALHPPADLLESRDDFQPYWILRRDPGTELDGTGLAYLFSGVKEFWQAFLWRRRVNNGEIRARHLQVVADVTSLLAGGSDLRKVIDGTCKALRDTGQYFRVVICLMTPDGTRIQSVGGSTAGSNAADLVPVADFKLERSADARTWEIQQYVAITGNSCVLEDATAPPKVGEPDRNRDQARHLNMRGIAVVPLKLMRGDGEPVEILGTIHIERHDKNPMDSVELHSIEILAGHTATAFDSTRKLNLLEQAVETLADEFRVLGPQGRVLFQNQAAEKKTPARTHPWVYPISTQPESEDNPHAQSKAVDAAREDGAGAHFYDMPDPEKPEQTWDDFAAPLYDFRNDLAPSVRPHGNIGFVATRSDLSDITESHYLLQSWLRISSLKKTTQSILVHFRNEGFQWCRIYLSKSKRNGEIILESFDEFGIGDGLVSRDFRHGKYTFSKVETTGEAWDTIDWRKGPFVFHYADGVSPQISPRRTNHGFEVVESGDRWRTVFEKDDIEWIEAPLYWGEQLIGVISTSMPSVLSPQFYERMRLWFSSVASAIRSSLDREEEVEHERNREAAHAASMALHQLTNKITPAESACRSVKAELSLPYDRWDLPRIIGALDASERGLYQARKILKDFNTFGSQKPLLDISTHRHDELADEMYRALRHQASETQIQLDLSKTEYQAPYRIRASKSALHEVFEVLIDNAIKHSGRSHEDLRITVSLQPRVTPNATIESVMEFRILENGVPIPEQVQRRMFDPFYSTKQAGNGLGLAIARDFVRRQGGELTYFETATNEKCFCVSLPLVDATAV